MRRFLFGVVIASATAAMPWTALGGDREIAKTVMSELQQYKEAGQLKGFDINMRVEDGVVYLTGDVATTEQRAMIARSAAKTAGSENVVNEIRIRSSSDAPAATSSVPAQRASSARQAATPSALDMATTDAIYNKLAQAKTAGQLRGFNLDVSTLAGDVWIRGYVANDRAKALVIDIARRTPGVTQVIDEVAIQSKGNVRPVSSEIQVHQPALVPPAPRPMPPQGSSMPVMGHPAQHGPQPFAPSAPASYSGYEAGGGGGPVPMNYAGSEFGAGAPRYDQPNLPNYAWPSYAAYPNYAAVTYPKQYSPSAWPYIGPFYPYPQVPLGWRQVTLQWDDGLWHLDFTSKPVR